MKLSNIFKKENKTVAKANVEKLEKNQLEKVIGGGDDSPTDAAAAKVKNGGKITGSIIINSGN